MYFVPSTVKRFNQVLKSGSRRTATCTAPPTPRLSFTHIASSLLRRRMKRNPHVLDARVCRAVLWWSILGEAMEAAKQAERRRAKRRESRRLVVMLAVSQRRGHLDSSTAQPQSQSQSEKDRPAEALPRSGMTRRSSRTWSLPPLTAGGDQSQGGGGRAPCHGGSVEVPTRGYRVVHLDEAAILSKIYDFL